MYNEKNENSNSKTKTKNKTLSNQQSVFWSGVGMVLNQYCKVSMAVHSGAEAALKWLLKNGSPIVRLRKLSHSGSGLLQVFSQFQLLNCGSEQRSPTSQPLGQLTKDMKNFLSGLTVSSRI